MTDTNRRIVDWDKVTEPLTNFECRTIADVAGLGQKHLFKMLNSRRAVVVLGAGVSAAYGYPLWDELVSRIVAELDPVYKNKDSDYWDLVNMVESTAYADPPTRMNLLSAGLPKPKFEEAFRKAMKKLGQSKGSTDRQGGEIEKSRERTDSPGDGEIEHLDVLAMLRDRLQIRRWVTLNFDDTLLQSLEALGFSSGNGQQDFHSTLKLSNQEGKLSRIISPGEEAFVDLLELSSGDRRYSQDIFHQHGRIGDESGGPLLIAEEEYRNRYLSEDPEQGLYRDGYDYLINSNPLLFVGVSLTEDDLMRPIRRRLSQKYRDHCPPIVALMPALDRVKKDVYEKIQTEKVARAKGKFERDLYLKLSAKSLSLYQKYGIYTIFYGADGAYGPNLEEKQGKFPSALSLQQACVEERRKPPSTFVPRRNRVISQALVEALVEISKDLDQWWDRWKTPPSPRASSLRVISKNPALYSRHYVDDTADLETIRRKLKAPLEMMPDADECLTLARLEIESHIAGESASVLSARFFQYELLERFLKSWRGPDRQDDAHGSQSPLRAMMISVIRSEFPGRIDNAGQEEKVARNEHRRRLVQSRPKGTSVSVVRGLVYGPRGSGKGSFASSIVCYWPLFNRIAGSFSDTRTDRYDSCLFVNTSASVEVESIIEAILEWVRIRWDGDQSSVALGDHQSSALDPRIDRLQALLSKGTEEKRLLLLVSGVDRLFPAGEPMNAAVRELFSVVMSALYIDIILFADDIRSDGESVWDLEIEKEFVQHRHYLPHVSIQAKDRPLTGEELIAQISLALNGHAYATSLLTRLRASTSQDERTIFDGRLKELAHWASSLSHAPALEYVLDWALRQFEVGLASKAYNQEVPNDSEARSEEASGRNGVSASVLASLALVGLPVEFDAILAYPEFDRERDNFRTEVRNCLDEQVRLGFVFETPGSLDRKRVREQPKYSLHRQLKHLVLSRFTSTSRTEGEVSFFAPSLYCMEPKDNPNFSQDSFYRVSSYLEAIFVRARELLEPSPKPETDCFEIPGLLRAAFGLTTTMASVGAIARIRRSPGDQHVRGIFDFLASKHRELYDLIRAASEPSKKTYRTKEIQRYPLYPQELVWLLNERGCLLLAMGSLYDASTVFSLAIDTAKSAYAGEILAVDWVRLNHAMVCIERGHLRRAFRMLEDVNPAGNKLLTDGSDITVVLTSLHRALISHIHGNFVAAREGYRKGIELLEVADRPRALGFFRMHSGNLHTAMKEYPLAEECYRLALSDAERGRQQDLVHRIRLARARLWLANGVTNISEISGVVRRAKSFAGRMALDSIYVEAASLDARIALSQGNLDSAKVATHKAMNVATRNGMKLRKLSAQMLLGEVLAASGQISTARAVVQTVLRQARHFGYHVVMEEGSQLLLQMTD